MDRLKTAMEQIEMSGEQQQRLLARVRQEAAKPMGRPRPWLKPVLAGAAACLLFLAALPLLSALLRGEPQWSITAYAAGQPGVTLVEGQPAEFLIKDDHGASVRHGVFGDFGGGEMLLQLRLVCRGDGVASVSYSSEDCKFAEVLPLLPGDPRYDMGGREAWEEHGIYLRTGPGGDGQGNITLPEKSAYVELGHSYSVAYDQQEEHQYILRAPLYEVSPPSPTEDGGWRGGQYNAEDVRISVAVTMENGRIYSKSLLLQAVTDPAYYEEINYYILPDMEEYEALSREEQKALLQEAQDQGYLGIAFPGFDPGEQPRFPTSFLLTVEEER